MRVKQWLRRETIEQLVLYFLARLVPFRVPHTGHGRHSLTIRRSHPPHQNFPYLGSRRFSRFVSQGGAPWLDSCSFIEFDCTLPEVRDIEAALNSSYPCSGPHFRLWGALNDGQCIEAVLERRASGVTPVLPRCVTVPQEEKWHTRVRRDRVRVSTH